MRLKEDIWEKLLEDALLNDLDILIERHRKRSSIVISDWVKVETGDNVIIGLIRSVTDEGITLDNNKLVQMKDITKPSLNEIQHEKQLRWWKNRGRKIWELSKGDVIKHENNGRERIVVSVEDDYVYVNSGMQIPMATVIDRFEIVKFCSNEKFEQ